MDVNDCTQGNLQVMLGLAIVIGIVFCGFLVVKFVQWLDNKN